MLPRRRLPGGRAEATGRRDSAGKAALLEGRSVWRPKPFLTAGLVLGQATGFRLFYFIFSLYKRPVIKFKLFP